MVSAIGVVLARFVPMPNAYMRFSIEAVPVIVGGLIFGPVPGAMIGLVADFTGCLFSGYGYNPVFSLPPMLIGICAGCLRGLLYARISYLRILATFFPAVVLGSMLWQSYWLSFFYGTRTFLGFLGMRSIQFAITSLINAAVVYALFKSRIFEALHLWPFAQSGDGASDRTGADRKAGDKS